MMTSWKASCAAALALVACALPAPAVGACSPADFEVRITRIEWERARCAVVCPVLVGAAVVTNRCEDAVGVTVRLVGLNEAGDPIAVHEDSPFGAENVAPGDHPISLDLWLDHSDGIVAFRAEVSRVRRW